MYRYQGAIQYIVRKILSVSSYKEIQSPSKENFVGRGTRQRGWSWGDKILLCEEGNVTKMMGITMVSTFAWTKTKFSVNNGQYIHLDKNKT